MQEPVFIGANAGWARNLAAPQGKKSQEYFVYFEIFQRGRAAKGPARRRSAPVNTGSKPAGKFCVQEDNSQRSKSKSGAADIIIHKRVGADSSSFFLFNNSQTFFKHLKNNRIV